MNDLVTCQSSLIVAQPAFVHRCLPRRLQLRVRISAGHFASLEVRHCWLVSICPDFPTMTFSVRTGLVGDAKHTSMKINSYTQSYVHTHTLWEHAPVRRLAASQPRSLAKKRAK